MAKTTRTAPSAATGSAQASIIEAARICIPDFKQFIKLEAHLRGYKIDPFQFEGADFLQGWKREHIAQKKKIMGFRLAAKTTLYDRWYVCWRWLRCPWLQVIVHSSTDAVSGDIGRSILEMLRNNPLLQHLCPPAGVAETQFNLAGIKHEQGFSLRTAGISTSLTSSRADLYIFDDPEPDIEPEAKRDRIIRAFAEAKHILHRPDRHVNKITGYGNVLQPPEHTQYVVLGQPHWIGSAYYPTEEEVASEDGHPLLDALEHRIPAVDAKTGYWTWPFMMERKHWNGPANRPMTIEEARRGYSTLDWVLQMQVDPESVRMLGAVLRVAHIERALRMPPHPVMFIDPADGGNCETAICIGGVFGNQIHWNYIGGFTGDTYEGDKDADDTIGESIWRRIFDIGDEYGVQNYYLEKNYKAASQACRRYLNKTGRPGSVQEFSSHGNKLRRICNGLEQPVNNGIVTADPGVLENPKTMSQLRGLRFDALPKPCDRIDAAEMLTTHLLQNPAVHQNERAPTVIPATLRPKSFGTMGSGLGGGFGQGGNPFNRVRG